MVFTALFSKQQKSLLSLIACFISSSFSLAQTSTFQSTCTSQDSILVDAFAKGCVQNWSAANGHPSFITSTSSALLASQEAIHWTKFFDKCVIQHVQASVQLSSPVSGKVSLTFVGANAPPFVITASLHAEGAGVWTSLYWHGIQLPHTYEGLQISFEGSNTALLLNEVQVRTECTSSLELANRAVGEVSAAQVTMTHLSSSPNENLHVKAGEGIVVTGEVTFKEGSDVVLTVAPCPTENIDCIIPPKVAKPLVVYNFLSPNGDGQNDTFFIEDLEEYPNAELVVLSKLGKVVYHAQPYKNDWNGGNEPKGTYTYQLRLEQGQTPLKGELLLER